MHTFQTLHNGVKIPAIGFGVFKLTDEAITERAILKALEVGYRHIDTAMIYGNEETVGKAIKKSGLKREELFITTKLWGSDIMAGTVQAGYEASLKRLGLDYVDLYLIHWPVPKRVEAWLELEKMYSQKQMKAIGVCNFTKAHFDELLRKASIVPMMNQIETHPYLQQPELHQYMADKQIIHQAWGPLGQGKSDLLTNPTIQKIAQKQGKTNAQVILRWHLQRGCNVIPKSQTPSRIEENFRVFDFSLSEEDMATLKAMDKNQHFATDPNNQEAVNKLV